MTHRQCKKYRDMFVEALYNELPESGRAVLQAHLKDCPRCAVEYEGMTAALGKMDRRKRPDMSEEYWENYWDRLEEKIDEQHIKIKDRLKLDRLWKWLGSFDFRPRRLLYPVSALLLIALGIFIGKTIYSPTPAAETMLAGRPAAASDRVNAAAVRHFDNLKPLLVECSNYTESDGIDKSPATIPVEKEILKKLILQHHLLKKAAAESSNSFLKQLIDELEIILLEISNSNGQSGQSMKAVRDILESNDILFKMNVYSNKNKRAIKI